MNVEELRDLKPPLTLNRPHSLRSSRNRTLIHDIPILKQAKAEYAKL